jgi:hypothetical protein
MSNKTKKISRKELRKLLGDMASGTFRMHISRGTLTEEDGKIDVLLAHNKEWIIEYCDKNIIDWNPIFETLGNNSKLKSANKVGKKNPPKPKANTTRNDYLPDRAIISKQKLEEETAIKRIKKEFDEIKLLDAKNKLLPVDMVVELFKIYIPGLTKDFIINGDKIIDSLIDEMGGDYETKLKYKKKLYETTNKTHENSHNRLSLEITKECKKFKFKP